MRVQTLCATGAEGQRNTVDVVIRGRPQGTIVFFPGDISAGREEMKADEESREWLEWNTEAICELLAKRCPVSMRVVLVRPSRMRQGFSCYDHFLTTNLNGDPLDGEYDPEGSCSLHLLMLLQDLSRTLNISEDEFFSSFHILAFSKGGVVINQLLAELGADVCVEGSRKLLAVTRSIGWLDPGVNEGSCVLLTNEELLRRAGRRLRGVTPPTTLFAVFTPFQLAVESYGFEYPEEEEAATSEELGLDLVQSIMKEEEVPFEVEFCCFDREPTMQTHFHVLKEFRTWRFSRKAWNGQMTNKERESFTRRITLTLSRSCVLM